MSETSAPKKRKRRPTVWVVICEDADGSGLPPFVCETKEGAARVVLEHIDDRPRVFRGVELDVEIPQSVRLKFMARPPSERSGGVPQSVRLK